MALSRERKNRSVRGGAYNYEGDKEGNRESKTRKRYMCSFQDGIPPHHNLKLMLLSFVKRRGTFLLRKMPGSHVVLLHTPYNVP